MQRLALSLACSPHARARPTPTPAAAPDQRIVVAPAQDGTHFFGEDGCGPVPFEAHTDDQVIAGMDPRGFSVAKPYPPCYDQFFGEGGLAAGVRISVRSAG